MCVLEFVIIAILLIVFLWIFPKTAAEKTTEGFDVYNNHAMGAQTVYETTGLPWVPYKTEDLTMDEARRLARYTWSNSGPQGLNVYDRYYERFVQDQKYSDQRTTTAADDIPYRDIGNDIGIDNVYDVKFHVYSGVPGIDGYSNYSITGMADPDPLYMEFNGETIVLNQKNF